MHGKHETVQAPAMPGYSPANSVTDAKGPAAGRRGGFKLTHRHRSGQGRDGEEGAGPWKAGPL